MINVNQGQCVAIAMIKAAVETKNNNQYNPLDFLFASICKILRKNRGACANNLKKVLLFSHQFSYFRPTFVF